jgi:G:T-mismatch repair DNA endonuclease (very short patch repair protein)/predicted transcriptional regulator
MHELYWLKKHTLKQIANLCGVSIPAIRMQLKRFGIPRRSNSDAQRLANNTDRITKEDLLRLYVDEDLSQKEIASIYGICQSRVSQHMLVFGIPSRGKAHSGPKNGMYGRTHTPGARAKLRASNKRQWAKPGAREACALRTIAQFQAGKTGKANNKLEQHMAKLLTTEGIRYQAQFRVGRFLFDFYLPAYHLLLEVHGRYWHADPRFYAERKLTKTQRRNIANDVKKQRRALKDRYLFLSLWEDDILSPQFSITPWLPTQLPLFS